MSNIDKRKLYLDMDGTITNTIKKICEMYAEDYCGHPKYNEPKWYLVETWNFEDQCPLASKYKIDRYFNEERFFDGLEFMENGEEIIHRLSNHFDIYVVSMGDKKNLKLKDLWLKEHLPYIKSLIGCDFNEVSDKSHVDMSGGILIDDSSINLETSNVDLKILYGDIYQWNKNWKGIRKFNWTEVEDFLLN